MEPSVYGCIMDAPPFGKFFVDDICCFCAIVTFIEELFND